MLVSIVQNGDVDVANGDSVPPNTIINSSLDTLIDVQSRFGVKLHCQATAVPLLSPWITCSQHLWYKGNAAQFFRERAGQRAGVDLSLGHYHGYG